MVAATIRTIFAQPTAEAVRPQLDTVADMLGTQFPKVKAMLLEAKDDLTAFAVFPERHWKKIQSTNPLERSAGLPAGPGAPAGTARSGPRRTPGRPVGSGLRILHGRAAGHRPGWCGGKGPSGRIWLAAGGRLGVGPRGGLPRLRSPCRGSWPAVSCWRALRV